MFRLNHLEVLNSFSQQVHFIAAYFLANSVSVFIYSIAFDRFTSLILNFMDGIVSRRRRLKCN